MEERVPGGGAHLFLALVLRELLRNDLVSLQTEFLPSARKVLCILYCCSSTKYGIPKSTSATQRGGLETRCWQKGTGVDNVLKA